MTRKSHPAARRPERTNPFPDEAHAWCEPLAGACPTGPWLEYDTAYTVLAARMKPPAEVQYGAFTQRRETASWPELERECAQLLDRSRDITLLVGWLRCRVHAAGAQGLEQGLRVFMQVLRAHGAQVHPQAHVDGEFDPALRANAVASLADPETLLAEIRGLEALGAGTEAWCVRDVERAQGGDAAARRELCERLRQAWRDGDTRCLALHGACCELRELVAWARDDLHEHAPDLGALQRVLGAFADAPAVDEPGDPGAGTPSSAHRVAEPADVPPEPSPEPAADHAPASESEREPELLRGRAHAQHCMERARAWFESHEPSSPVCVLLRQAERLVGKRYAEVAQAIPPDLLARWDAPDQTGRGDA